MTLARASAPDSYGGVSTFECWYQQSEYTNNKGLIAMDGNGWRKTKNPLITRIGAGLVDFFGRWWQGLNQTRR
jgi:hypothetical protein